MNSHFNNNHLHGHYSKVSQTELEITHEGHIVDVRLKVRALAQNYEFDSFSLASLITAASELARNVWVHAGAGKVLISIIQYGLLIGMEMEFIDQGPGIADLSRALAGGHSTQKSLGLGLSGSKKLVDEFFIKSTPGEGTTILIRKWKKRF